MLNVRPVADTPEAALKLAFDRAPYLRRLAGRELEDADWREALEHGATHLRIGTAITGNRPADG